MELYVRKFRDEASPQEYVAVHAGKHNGAYVRDVRRVIRVLRNSLYAANSLSSPGV